MSKVVLVCPRDPARIPEFEAKLRQLEHLILPDDFTPNPLQMTTTAGVICACYHPAAHLLQRGASLCLGMMLNPRDDWWQPGAALPDGVYALFRAGDDQIELATDILASRHLWYARTGELFIAATSQRAIVALLGNFEFNQVVIPWFLSSGTLGLANGWDRRIHKLRGSARLMFDRRTWEMHTSQTPLEDTPVSLSDEEHIERTRAAIQQVFDHMAFTPSQWVISLSGGVDSRLLRLSCQKR